MARRGRSFFFFWSLLLVNVPLFTRRTFKRWRNYLLILSITTLYPPVFPRRPNGNDELSNEWEEVSLGCIQELWHDEPSPKSLVPKWADHEEPA